MTRKPVEGVALEAAREAESPVDVPARRDREATNALPREDLGEERDVRGTACWAVRTPWADTGCDEKIDA